MGTKKFTDMTDEQRRTYVQKQKEKAWKTYEHWKGLSLKLNQNKWTKADIDLIDILIEKDHA